MLDRILLVIFLDQPSCIASVKVPTVSPGPFCRGERLTLTEFPPAISIVPSEPVNRSALAVLTAIHKIHPKAQVESLRIVEQRQHHIRNIAPILPEAQSTRSHRTRRPHERR
jgi:hypothetical protein